MDDWQLYNNTGPELKIYDVFKWGTYNPTLKPGWVNPNIPSTTRRDFSQSVESDAWVAYRFGNHTKELGVSNNLLHNLTRGTGVKQRTGVSIRVNKIEGSTTFFANKLYGKPADALTTYGVNVQHGESCEWERTNDPDEPPYDQTPAPYIRTTVRRLIVLNKKQYDTRLYLPWDHVMGGDDPSVDPNTFIPEGMGSGVHSFMRDDVLKQFEILDDLTVELDAKTPQVTIPFCVEGDKVGTIRYNENIPNTPTSKGIYVIWAAYSTNFWEGFNWGSHQIYNVSGAKCHLSSRTSFLDL